MIDLLAILPSLLPLFAGGLDLRWLRVLRMARLLKMSHFSSALEDLTTTVYEERRSLGAALYLFLIAIFLSSAMLYLAENKVQPEFFSSIPQTMWWSIITLTTVGYGDVSPITPLGQVFGAMTAVMGVMSVALLTGIVASGFSSQMSRRKKIVEAEIAEALSDGVISEEEEKHIEELRKKLNLSEEHVNSITEILKHEKNQGSKKNN
jgi:voltage-gated potassium channel